MGSEVVQESFCEADYAKFGERLGHCVDVLGKILARPGFGAGPPSLGAELELALIDARGRALPLNRAVLAETLDPRFTVELNRFNLECNLRPCALAGRPFAALREELMSALSEIRTAAARHGGRVVPIGILPTLRPDDLQASAMTDSARYRALSAALRRLRDRPFQFRIDGLDSLRLETEDVTFEGAATSLQIHLRVAPEDFADAFNAAELATGPILAVSGNSPIFLERRLWDETRIALFKQAVDDRTLQAQARRRSPRVGFGSGWVEEGALELFEAARAHEVLLPVSSEEDPVEAFSAGRTPRLDEIRLHQGTVWSWNRPIYDSADGGHLRIELRALPAGPSISDMIANSAFLVGLTRGLMPMIRTRTRRWPFAWAEENFYRAAQRGLSATLVWPDPEGAEESRRVPAAELVRELLPVARQGLESAGIELADFEPWLGIIAARCANGQTGAVWQRAALRAHETRGRSRPDALSDMLEDYLVHSQADQPVHTWPIPESGP